MNRRDNHSTKRQRFQIVSALVLLLVELCWPWRVSALDPRRELSQYNCQSWTRQNGLPASGISSIAQTIDGYLWFGTPIGLERFDGMDFRLFDLSQLADVHSSIVTSLARSDHGGLWVGMEHGSFGFYDGKNFSFQGKPEWGGPDVSVHGVLESKDHSLWLAAEHQIARLKSSGEFEPMLEKIVGTNYTEAFCAYEDRHDRIWFGTANQGVYCWHDGNVSQLLDPQPDPIPAFCVTEDLDGNIWIGTGNGLRCYDSNLRPKEIPQLAAEIHALLVDSHGVLWIGTTGQGLARYRNGNYDFLEKTEGLAGNYVRALAEDREGSLWVGTRDGISQISDVKFPIQNATADGLVKDALGVAASRKGGVWITSPGGLTYFQDSTNRSEAQNSVAPSFSGTIVRTYTADDGLPSKYTKRAFEASNGDLYFVYGSRGLGVFSNEKVLAAFHADTLIVGMAEDADGVVVSVGGALYRAGPNYFTPYVFQDDEKPNFAWVLNLTTSRDGSIWVACGNGIFRVKDGHCQSPPENLLGRAISWVCEDDDGVVWGGTLQGIVRLKNGHATFIDRKHGLFDDNIYCVLPDDFGRLWVDSGRGIFCVSRQEMNDFADGKVERVHCTAYDGLEAVKTTDKTVQERVGCKTADGRIWFPSSRGVVIVDPAHIATNQVAPPVHIDYVRINGKEITQPSTLTNFQSSLIIPPGKGELEFHFDALTFIAPQKVRFRYRLEGYDADWVDAGDRHMAFYTNLKPGRYTFRVMAANADGVWNESGDAMKMELRPHFYQTIWFYLLSSIAGLAVLAAIYLWRVQVLEMKQRALQKNRDLLENEVQRRTAELANANNSLQQEIEKHKETTVELEQRTRALEIEIEERKQMQAEVERVHRQLMDASRQAGMAEVASNVLHNVGNVLNSVNVSATLAADMVQKFKVTNFGRVVSLLDENAANLPEFLTQNPKGTQVLSYMRRLHDILISDQQRAVAELESLRKNIEHIKEIVVMQQSYAKMAGFSEVVNIVDLVEDSLRMNEGALQRHEVRLLRQYQKVPPVTVEKHKVLQILVNLIRNAKYACDEGTREEKLITMGITNGNGRIKISVKDTGIGIPTENLTRIFNHGFTTRKHGHGFGLHSGALAAKEMGGELLVQSDGIGKGAIFTLELPIDNKGDLKGN